MTEEWKNIEGTDGLYQVSNLGRVRSFVKTNGRGGGINRRDVPIIMKGNKAGRGYWYAWIRFGQVKRQSLIHRLVLETFTGPPPSETHEANHKDLNLDNNRLDNLEWVTRKENMEHAGDKRRAIFKRPDVRKRMSDAHKGKKWSAKRRAPYERQKLKRDGLL